MLENCPEVPMIFPDRCALHTGRALNVVTHEVNDAPAVDVFVAGFVCKSMSNANQDRAAHGQCIADGTGQTGETCQGVQGYVRRFRPKLVICEALSTISGCVVCVLRLAFVLFMLLYFL